MQKRSERKPECLSTDTVLPKMSSSFSNRASHMLKKVSFPCLFSVK